MNMHGIPEMYILNENNSFRQQNARSTGVNETLHVQLSCKTGCNILCMCVFYLTCV